MLLKQQLVANRSRNAAFNIANQVTSVVFPLVTLMYLSRTLGAKGLGSFALALSIVQAFQVIGNFGLDILGQRNVARVSDSSSETERVLVEVIGIRVMLNSLVMCFYLVALLNWLPEMRLLLAINCIYLVASALDTSWFLIGKASYPILVTRTVILRTVGLVMTIVLVRNEGDTSLYALVSSLTSAFSSLLLMWNIRKFLVWRKLKKLLSATPKYLREALPFFATQALIVISGVASKTIISNFCSLQELGIYDTVMRIGLMVVAVVSAIPSSLTAEISLISHEGGRDALNELIRRSTGLVGLISIPAAFGLAALSQVISIDILGPSFYGSATIMQMSAPIVFVNSMSFLIGTQYQQYSGKESRLLSTLTISAVAGIFVSLLIVPKYGLIGATLVALAAELAILGVHTFRSRGEIKFLSMVMGQCWKQFLSSLGMYCVVVLVSNAISELSVVLRITISIGTGVVVYEILLLALGDKSNRYMISRVFGFLRKVSRSITETRRHGQ